MCLGSQAAAANANAQRQYEYKLQKRKADWMQQLSLAGVERIEYEQGINATKMGVANMYADIQQKHGQLIDEAVQADQDSWKQFLEKSPGANLAASGVTGKSAQRIQSLDLAEYLVGSAQRARQLSNDSKELNRQGAKAAGAAAAQQKQAWMKQQIIKMPDFAPPPPVMQNVGAAAFMDALKIGTSVATTFGSGGLNWLAP